MAGQRYWSSMLNHKAVITCGIWTPDDQQVYFGTTAGQLIVMDVHGAMVSEVQLSEYIEYFSISLCSRRKECCIERCHVFLRGKRTESMPYSLEHNKKLIAGKSI